MGHDGTRMKIAIQGLWHLGSVTAGCMAALGHEVTALDHDRKTVQGLQQGRPPVYEPGLEEMIRSGLASGNLRFVSDPAIIPNDIEVLWVTYDTPVNEEDEADVDFVITQIRYIMPYMPTGVTILVSSQMPVGSIRGLEVFAIQHFPGKCLGFACSPENLRLGKALDVFLKPDRIIVGIRSERDRTRIELLLHKITERIEWMSVESAEMTKHAINAFLATSVVFANEIASLCELVGADAKEVERGLKSEQRIGPKAYLSPGGPFAGGTLARDIEFLKAASKDLQLALPLVESVKTSNDHHKEWVPRKLASLFSNLHGMTIAVWGLTYKPGTDTLRRSLSVELCHKFIHEGAYVRVHDPAVRQLPPEWTGVVQRFDNPLETITGAQVLVIGTEWPDYKKLTPEQIVGINPRLIVLDPNRFLSSLQVFLGSRYIAVGTPVR